MKKAKADRIMWDVGTWIGVPRKRGKAKRKWMSRLVYNSRADARTWKMSHESVRRCEVFYVD